MHPTQRPRKRGEGCAAYLELPVPRDTAMEVRTSRPSEGAVDSMMRSPLDLANKSAFTRLTVLVVICTDEEDQLPEPAVMLGDMHCRAHSEGAVPAMG